MFNNDSTTQPASDHWSGTEKEVALIEAAKAADTKAFNILFLEYAPKVYCYLAYFVTSSVEAETITSQVFLKMWQELRLYNYHNTPILIWIYAQADYYINQQKEIQLKNNPDEADSKEPSFLAQPAIKNKEKTEINLQPPGRPVVSWQMYNLPEYNRLVLYLHFIEGLSFDKISHLLRVTNSRVQNLYQDALNQFARSYKTGEF